MQYAPLHPHTANALLTLMDVIDAALAEYANGSQLVDAARVIDTLLEVRNGWLDVVMAET
jgi:hypothetical protein